MKILHIINTCDPKSGGPIEGLKQYYEQYKKNNIYAEILCSDEPNSYYLKDSKLPKVNAMGKGLFNYSFNFKLLKWLEINIDRFDFLIVNGVWQFHNYAVWKIAKIKKIPYFVFTHGMLDPWFKYKYPLKHLKKIIYWYIFQHKFLNNAKKVFFTSIEEKRLAKKSFKNLLVKSEVICYGISNSNSLYKNNKLFNKKFSKIKNKKIILFLGRLHPKKGLENLIDAFSKIDLVKYNLHLLIVGPSSKNYKDKILKIVQDYKLNKFITFENTVLGKLKSAIINSCKIFALPSHQENFGIAVVEALRYKKPVLISDKVNIWREIKEFKAGFIGKDTAEGTKRSLIKWLKTSENEQKIISQNAYKCFNHKFNLNKTFSSFINVIKSEINDNKK